MSSYTQGRRVEYAVTAHLRDNGYEIQRAASSKGIADVIAIKEGQILLCSVKRTAMPSPAERAELLRVSRMLPGLVPLVAIGRPHLSFRRLFGEGAKQWESWVADELAATDPAATQTTESVCDPNALTGTCRWDHDHDQPETEETP